MGEKDVSGPSQVRSKETKKVMVIRTSAENRDCGRGAAEVTEVFSHHRTVLERGSKVGPREEGIAWIRLVK